MHAADLTQRRSATRALLRSAVESYSLDHATEIAARNHAALSGTERKNKIVPTLAVEVTVGAGKSRAVSETIVPMIFAADQPILILAPTREMCDEYAASIQASGIACTVYKPRQAVKKGHDSNPWSCFQLDSINTAGERYQRPAQSICRQCPNGYKAALGGNDQSFDAAIKWFKKHDFNEDKIAETEACRYLYEGLPDQLRAEVLIAPVAAFSEALATLKFRYTDNDGRDAERTVQRLIISDERFDLTEKVSLSAPSIEGWLSTIDRGIQLFKDNEQDDQREALASIKSVLAELAARLISEKKIDTDLRQQVTDAVKLVKQADLVDGGTAFFERVSFMPDNDDFFIPLRAFSALADAMKKLTDEVEVRSLRVSVPKPLIDWSVKHGSTIILDATLDPTLRELVKSSGGRVLNAQAPQNITVARVGGKMFARGRVTAEEYSKKAAREIKHLKKIAERMPKPAAIITHKAFLHYAESDADAEAIADNFEAETGVKLGWFGRHDRGHNAWSGRHIAIVGMPIYSPGVIRGLWQERRVLLDSIGIEVDELKTQDEQEGAFMPADPDAVAWLCEIYAANLVQAIGRARGINREGDPLQIYLVGGIDSKEMDTALARSMVNIHQSIKYTDFVTVERENDPRWRIRAAISELARGRKGLDGVSRRAVESWLMRAGHKTSKHDIVDEEIRQFRAQAEAYAEAESCTAEIEKGDIVVSSTAICSPGIWESPSSGGSLWSAVEKVGGGIWAEYQDHVSMAGVGWLWEGSG
jgi:hypothetical protein